MKKGEIFWAIPKEREGKNPHPIVYWEPCDWHPNKFKAYVLSTKPHHKGLIRNVLMHKSHFQPTKPDGTPYSILFCNSHLVVQGFVKDELDVCETCDGKLTEKGIRFVEEHINPSDVIDWPLPVWELTKGKKKRCMVKNTASMSNTSSNNRHEAY